MAAPFQAAYPDDAPALDPSVPLDPGANPSVIRHSDVVRASVIRR